MDLSAYSHWPFFGLLLLLGVQRLLEMRRSARNERRLLAQGGREHAPRHFALIRLMHVAWFVAIVAEVLWFGRPFVWQWALPAALVVAIGQVLRYAAIRTLGERWTVRVMTPAVGEPVRHGIYRYLRHPNYLGVVLEIAAFPLLHSAWLTACVFSAINAMLLAFRIAQEERALAGN